MATTDSKQHSRTSLSGAYRWLACPGSIPFSETLTPLPESPEMREGTEAHRVAEGLLRECLERETTITADDGFNEDLMGFVCHVLDLRDKHKPPKILLEQRVTLDAKLDLYGTLDVAMRTGKRSATIIDLKWGAGYAVPAEGNAQLAAYAAALDRMYGPFESIEAQIYQPRAYDPVMPVRSWVLDRDAIQTWKKRLIDGAKVVSRMSKDDPSTWGKLTTGEHCRTCPCAGVCPALAIHTEPARGVLDPATVEDAVISTFKGAKLEAVVAERVQALSSAELSRVLQAGPLAEVFLKAVRKRALADALAGNPPEGHKVVEGRSKRVPGDGWEEGVRALGADPFEPKRRSFTSIEKELGKGAVDHLLIKPRGKPTLVPVGDPRLPYVASGGIEDFPDDLEDGGE